MPMIKIGYQGIEGSNNEEAAKNMATRLGITEYELIPLVNSQPVIGSLKRGEIDYGVIAIKNSLGGVVKESFDAIKNEYLELVSTEILPIHHSLFKNNAEIKNSELKKVVSHVQAFKQTENNLQKILPEVEVEEIDDTAIGAQRLANGELDDNVAVICRKNAGEDFGLELIQENIEDRSDNYTEFRMFKMSTIDYENNEKPSLIDNVVTEAVNDRGLGHISKAIFVLAIFLGFYVNEQLNWTAWEVATTIGGVLSAIFLFLTSSQLQDKVRYSYIKGYWKYYSLPENRELIDINQSYKIKRIVEISEVDDELVFTGWISDLDNVV